MGGGLGSDGGMADYMLVPSPRLLVPLGKLDPAIAAPLSDAALTPYHAIKAALPMLTPDTHVLVIGPGKHLHQGPAESTMNEVVLSAAFGHPVAAERYGNRNVFVAD